MNAHSPLTVGDVEIPASEVPFLVPPDRVACIDLPPPVSVNQSRKVDWAARRKVKKWIASADMLVLSNGGVRKAGAKMPGKFEATIVLDEKLCRADGDNLVKGVLDYCKRIGLIVDDSPKYMRRHIVEYGHAPTGCRVTLRELG
jgi:Holliday junction resolvase RusA-like endonuclease